MVGNPVDTAKGYRVTLQRVRTPSWYGADVDQVTVDVEFHTDSRLRVKIYDTVNTRFEVPMNPAIPSPPSRAPNPLYDITFSNSPSFNFKVTRRSSGTVLFDTSIGGLKFSDQFLQIAARLPTSNIYGWGETMHSSLRHNVNWKTYGMFGRDEPVAPTNLYGVHPFFTTLESDGNMFGALILNSNAQEVTITPAPGFIYRTTGGILDLYFFLGPAPETVISQYTEAVGHPVMPAYWSLGFQLSRYGYDTLANMQAAVERTRAAGIPQDVQHGDIDYFDRNLDFTYDPVRFAGLPDYVRQLKTEGIRFITLLDPFIGIGEPPGTYPAFDRGQELNIWVKESDGVTPAESRAWPLSNVYYGDYAHASGDDWWIEQCVDFHDTIEFDGLWVDMNEPASFEAGSVKGCLDNRWNFPLYKPRYIAGSVLYEKTICTDYEMSLGRHYDVHNLYGRTMAIVSQQAVRQATGGKRSIIIGRSSFPGSGHYAGRWLGDNQSAWSHLHHSIIGVLEFNLFGMPYIGPDICGFFQDSTMELCARWMEVGAFFTFARNHNGLGWADQDPGLWPEVGAASRSALLIRYTLLPFLYTLFHQVHVSGGTVLRPLHHEFPTDVQTHSIDTQFLWGPAFLITPVITQGATSVTGYFPNARWYRYADGILESARGSSATLTAPLEFIPLHVRGGYILPTQEPATSTMFSRSNPLGLIAALDDGGNAVGSLFWDEGDTPDTYETGNYFQGSYVVNQRTLTGGIDVNGYSEVSSLHFATVSVWGVATAPSQVTVNGSPWSSYIYDGSRQVLDISQLSITVNSAFTITW
jgi:alpha-glucosidase (family GH31 glycosyl hydrolase)